MLDGEPRVGPERDGGLDLDDRGELQGRVLLEGHLLKVGLLHRLDAGLGEGLAVDVGDEPPRHFLAHIVGEVELDHAAPDLALAESGQLGLTLPAAEGLFPGSGDHLGGFLDLQPSLAGPHLLDVDFHGCSALTIGKSSLGRLIRPASYTIEPHRQ